MACRSGRRSASSAGTCRSPAAPTPGTRNPGTGEPLATATTLRAAEQVIHHDPPRPSAVLLPATDADMTHLNANAPDTTPDQAITVRFKLEPGVAGDAVGYGPDRHAVSAQVTGELRCQQRVQDAIELPRGRAPRCLQARAWHRPDASQATHASE